MRLQYLIILFLIIILAMASPVTASGELRPSAPPRIPVMDYGEDHIMLMDLNYVRVGSDDETLTGFGGGFNYVGAFGENSRYGYNAGIGGIYLTGSSLEGGMIPVNVNLATRIRDNIIFFGGAHYAYGYIYMDIGEGIDVYVHQGGPLLGFKMSYKVNERVTFIPFYVGRIDFVDIETYSYANDRSYYYDDTVWTNIIGFDIEIGSFSIGAMLDMLNSAGDDMININVTIRL